MFSGSKWFDVVVGVNVHSVIVPGTPNPVLLPHIYIGIVFDPLGLMLSERARLEGGLRCIACHKSGFEHVAA